MKYTIAVVDHFTKWAEDEPLASITEAKTSNFILRNIIYRFGIPYATVTDSEKHFDNAKFRSMCT